MSVIYLAAAICLSLCLAGAVIGDYLARQRRRKFRQTAEELGLQYFPDEQAYVTAGNDRLYDQVIGFIV